MLKKYIAGEPEVDVVHTSNKDDATIAVTGVIYQDTDPELGEVPEGYQQKERVRDVKLGDDLSENQRCMLKDLIRRRPNHGIYRYARRNRRDSAQSEANRCHTNTL